MIDFAQFFSIVSGGEPGQLVVTPTDSADPTAVLGGDLEIVVPRVYRREMGTKPMDFMRASDLTVLIRDRVVSLLADQQITGWRTYPVEAYGVGDRALPDYHGLVVTGRAMIDDERSERRILPPPVPEGQPHEAWMGLYFEPQSWDGSDLFLLTGSQAIVATARVKEVLEAAAVSDVAFESLPDIENYLLTLRKSGH